jgi:hypothetical protein
LPLCANAIPISWNTSGYGSQTFFSGLAQETIITFGGESGTTELALGVDTTVVTHNLTFIKKGTWDGANPPEPETINVSTLFSVGSASATLVQEFTIEQIANDQFMITIGDSRTATLDLGAEGLLDITALGTRFQYRRGTGSGGGALLSSRMKIRHAPKTSLFVHALGDINGDGSQDIVALFRKDGKLVATVKDSETPRWIRTIRFDSNLVPVDLEVMTDSNGNGAPELVVLGIGSIRSEVRDSLTGEKLGAVSFDLALSPIDLELLTDQTGNGIPELAMLGQGSMRVEVKDPVTNALVKKMYFNDYIPIDLSVWDRGDNVSVGVLAESKDPTRSDKVEIRDLASGQIIKHIWVSKAYDLLQMELMDDLNGNGAPELAILREHPVDNWVSVQAMDTASGSRFMRLGFDPNYRPIRMRVLDDVNGNGSEEVAVLAVRRGCCNQKVWVKDTLTGESIRIAYFGKKFIGEDLAISPDMNGNGTPELIVLGRRDDGKIAAIIKDSKTAELISWVGF